VSAPPAVRKSPRVPISHEAMGDPKGAARLLAQFQSNVAATLDQLVQRANVPGPNVGTSYDAPAGASLAIGASASRVTIGAPGVSVVVAGVPPTGALLMFAGATAPAGYLVCNGAAVSRATYAALFAVLGTTYGAGDGSTTFNLPDMRSRAPVGAGQGSGLTNRALAATGGEEAHALSVGELAAHNHGVTDPGHTHTLGVGSGDDTANTGTSSRWPDYIGGLNATVRSTANVTTGISTQNAGSGTAHNNMQPFLAVNFIVKT
jgi:microcystin-dependent protein